jgi:glutamyl/glutaminyl-tRNA synthetase
MLDGDWSSDVCSSDLLLGLPEPVYHHHRLVTDPTGRKLAKSAADTALAELRAAGSTADEVRRMVDWAETEARLPAIYRVLRETS